jgi:CheY-like chemotaxis protein
MSDLNQSTENQKRKSKRILIAEPDSDIQYLYSLYTKQYGFSIFDVSIVENGKKCLELIFSNTAGDDGNNNAYDVIILDTHFMAFQALKLQERSVIDYHIKKYY